MNYNTIVLRFHLSIFIPKSIELKNSPNFINASEMEEHKHYSMGSLAGPWVFSTKPTRPPGSSNTQCSSRANLNFGIHR